MACVNVYLLYRETLEGEARKRITVHDIKSKIVRDLIEMSKTAEGAKKLLTRDETNAKYSGEEACHRRFSMEPHLPKRIEGGKASCVCHKVRTWCEYQCGTCRVPLCLDDCYEKFHNKYHYFNATEPGVGPRGGKERIGHMFPEYQCKHVGGQPIWAFCLVSFCLFVFIVLCFQ